MVVLKFTQTGSSLDTKYVHVDGMVNSADSEQTAPL